MTEGDFSNVAVANLPESLPVIDISLRILYKFRNNFYKEHIQKAKKKKKKTLWPLFMDGVQLPQGLSHFEEAVYFLPLSSQKFLVLILSTSGG